MGQKPCEAVPVLSAVFLLSFVFLLAVAFAGGGGGGNGTHNSSMDQSPSQPTPPAPPAPQCKADADCNLGQSCKNGLCMPSHCTFDSNCGLGLSCRDICMPPSCTTDPDCGAGKVCKNSLCIPVPEPCNVSADCGGGKSCKNNLCISLPPPCNSTADCTGGQSCGSFCMIVPCNSTASCGPNEYCQDHACVMVPCACGTIQNHQCVKYACCTDTDCGAGKSCLNNTCLSVNASCNTTADCPAGVCQNNTCVAVAVTPGGGIITTPPPSIGGCNSSGQCMATQSCGNGVCSDVTGECGYAANHSWVPYACGTGPGCPACPGGNICMGHICTKPASMALTGKDVVGENLTLTVTYPSGPCSACALELVSPSGMLQDGTTDASGRFIFALNEKGTYNVTLVSEGQGVSVVALVPSSPQETPVVTLIYDALAASPLWLLAVLLLLVGLALYLRRRGK